MMTRKDYVSTAEILNKATDKLNPSFNKIVSDFIVMFKNDNPRFDANRFIDAVFKEVN